MNGIENTTVTYVVRTGRRPTNDGTENSSGTYVVNTTLICHLYCCIVKDTKSLTFFSVRQPVI